MPSLFGRAPKDSFQELLKLNNTGAGVDSTMRAVQDGTGVNTPLQLSTTQIALNGAYWPTTLGTSGQVLTAGSNGTMTWTTAPTYAPLASPTFTGVPVAPTATAGTNTTQLATTAFVTAAVPTSNSQLTNGAGYITASGAPVQTVAGRTGAVTLSTTDISGISSYATLASPALTGTPVAPTATAGTNTTQLATTAFVHNTVGAIAGGLTFSGTWNATTNSPSITSGTGTTGQMYKVATAGTTTIDGNSSWSVGDLLLFDGTTWDKIDGQASEVVSFNSRFGAVSLTSSDVTTALGFTPANTATVSSTFAPLASPALTGTPTVPTATAGTSTTQAASTAFVGAAITAAAPNLSTYAPLASPALTGTPVAPTATAGTNTTQIATTAFVTSAIVTAATGVASFNTRTGAVVLSSSDVTTALTFTPANAATVASTYAPLASPALTGVPVAPTATAGTNTTQLATTAFVTTAVPTNTNQLTNGSGFITSSGAPVQTVAGRTGAVVLSTTDISGIGSYALLASPALTGTPTAPTASSATNTTQIATTAFVQTAVSGVSGSAANSSIVSASVGAGYNLGTATNVFYNLTNTSTGAVLTPAANTLAQGWTTTIYINAGTSTSALTTLASNGGSDFFIITGNGSSGVSMLLGYAYKLTAIPSLNRFMVDVTESLGSADVTKALGYTPVNPATAALTGTPTAPTATAGTNTTQLATTAFVAAAIPTNTTQLTNGSGFITTSALSTYAPLASPVLTGVPVAPTATTGTNTTQLATTAFVNATVTGAAAGVASFNTRTGAVTLTSSDVTTALGTTSTITATDYETSALSIVDGGGDPSFANVTALSHFESIATNATSFVDVINNTWTVVSGPTFSTTQAKFGTESVSFTGSGALTTAASVTDFQAGDFTLESWIYPTLNSAAQKAIIGNGYNVQFYLSNLTIQLLISIGNNSTYVVNMTSTSNVTLNTWNHVAATRQGNVFTLWINGASAGTATVAVGTIATSSWVTCIGNDYIGSYVAPFTGYLDEVRITKGVARYTTAFTVPSIAFANTTASGARIGFRSTGTLQFGSTTGSSNAGFATVGQIDSTGLNATVIGATTPAAGTFTTLAANTAAIGTNSTQVASTAFVQNTTQTNLNVALVASNVTLAATQYGSSLLTFTGTLTANVIVTFPTQGQWTLLNSTSGAFTVTVSNGAGATIVIPSGATLEVISNSTLGMVPSSSMAVTATAGTNTTQIATTAFVANSYAPLASPTLTGRTQSPAYSFSVVALGSVSGTQTLNMGLATEWTATITGATTFAFTNTLAANTSEVFFLRLTNAGASTIAWPSGTQFANKTAPVYTTSGVDLFGIMYDTTASAYLVFVIGLNIG